MRMPEPVWPVTYSASRRAHHHRCACCNRILKDGEAALMARTGKKTRVVHEECAAKPYDPAGAYVWRDALWTWGIEYLAALGYREAKSAKAEHPIFRAAPPPALEADDQARAA